MQLPLDVVQLIVNMLNLPPDPPPIIILFPALKLPVQNPHLVLQMTVLAPNLTIGTISPHAVAHVRQHPIQMLHLALNLPESVATTVTAALSSVLTPLVIMATRIGALKSCARLIDSLLTLLLILFVVLMRRHWQDGAAQA